EACVWGAFTNAGQTCVGIERVYVAAEVYAQFLDEVVARARRLVVGGPERDLGPVLVPAQVEVIRAQIADALARGATAVLGGVEAVEPPYVRPTVLVDVPPDATVLRQERSEERRVGTQNNCTVVHSAVLCTYGL